MKKCDNLFCAPKLVSKLLNGNKLRIAVKHLEDGSLRKITNAVRHFVPSPSSNYKRTVRQRHTLRFLASSILHISQTKHVSVRASEKRWLIVQSLKRKSERDKVQDSKAFAKQTITEGNSLREPKLDTVSVLAK